MEERKVLVGIYGHNCGASRQGEVVGQFRLCFSLVNRCLCVLGSDNDVGAACATGDGDEILKYCPCYRVVQLMSSDPSLSPTDACTRVVQDICDRRHRHKQHMFEVGLIAMNVKVLQTSEVFILNSCNYCFKFIRILIKYKNLLTCTMSVSWQNRRCGQSLVAHGRVKNHQQNNVFLSYV